MSESVYVWFLATFLNLQVIYSLWLPQLGLAWLGMGGHVVLQDWLVSSMRPRGRLVNVPKHLGVSFHLPPLANQMSDLVTEKVVC